MSMKPEAIIYTDGSCLDNPGPGGWGAIVCIDGKYKQMSGGAPKTTNNRMELTAAINALSTLRGPHLVTLYTDSQYLAKAFTEGWVKNWKSRKWAKADGELKNKDLWQILDKLSEKHTITWVWVKGHDGNLYNEQCDKMAVAAAKSYQNGEGDNPALLFGVERDMEPLEPKGKGAAQDDTDQAKAAATGQTGAASEETSATKGESVSDIMRCFQCFIEQSNQRRVKTSFPCGGEPWCEFCPDMQPKEGVPQCAEAYIAYIKERNRVKDAV